MDRRAFLGAGALLAGAPLAHARTARSAPPPASSQRCVNVMDYGAVGDGVHDDTSKILAAFDACPPFGTVCFPARPFCVSQTLEPAGGKIIHLQMSRGKADSWPDPTPGGLLIGNFDGPILRMTGSEIRKGPILQGLAVKNLHQHGSGIHIGHVHGGAMRDCSVAAQWRGVILDRNTFTFRVDSLLLQSSGNQSGSVGITANGHAHLSNLDVAGWDHGIRASGTTVNITGCRIEVNIVGLMCGMDVDGNRFPLTRSMITGCSFEANDTQIDAGWLVSSVLQGIGLDGHAGGPLGPSKYGINCTGWPDDVLFAGIQTSGGHALAGIKMIRADIANRLTLISCGFDSWDIENGPGRVVFIQTNYPGAP